MWSHYSKSLTASVWGGGGKRHLSHNRCERWCGSLCDNQTLHKPRTRRDSKSAFHRARRSPRRTERGADVTFPDSSTPPTVLPLLSRLLRFLFALQADSLRSQTQTRDGRDLQSEPPQGPEMQQTHSRFSHTFRTFQVSRGYVATFSNISSNKLWEQTGRSI